MLLFIKGICNCGAHSNTVGGVNAHWHTTEKQEEGEEGEVKLNSHTAAARTVVVGKMAALLLQELEPSEISKLSKTVQNKLEKVFSDQQYDIDSLKAQQEQFRVDSGKGLPGVS